MRQLIIGLLLCVLCATHSLAQKTVNEYYPLYVQNSRSLMILGRENVMTHKNEHVTTFLLEYPILDKMKDFNRREKYSMINIKLCKGIPYESGKWIVVDLINGHKYRFKAKKVVQPPF